MSLSNAAEILAIFEKDCETTAPVKKALVTARKAIAAQEREMAKKDKEQQRRRDFPWEFLPVAARPGKEVKVKDANKVPKGYVTFAPGNSTVTADARRFTLRTGKRFYRVMSRGWRYPVLWGYGCPSNIYDMVLLKNSN